MRQCLHVEEEERELHKQVHQLGALSVTGAVDLGAVQAMHHKLVVILEGVVVQGRLVVVASALHVVP